MVKVDLITGFLGSGKTTFIKKYARYLMEQGQNIGILVAGVSEILRIPDESIEPTPPIVASGVSSDFIRGVAKVDGRLIIFLDLDRIFSVEEQEALYQSVE